MLDCITCGVCVERYVGLHNVWCVCVERYVGLHNVWCVCGEVCWIV